VRGVGVGHQLAAGRVRVLTDPAQGDKLADGDVLVTEMTDPDWVSIMARAGAIVTDRGGRTAHAAIVSRELGVPAVVGTGEATRRLTDGDLVTVSCAHGGEGRVYAGELAWDEQEVRIDELPETRTKIMINLASPARRSARGSCRPTGWASPAWSSSSTTTSRSTRWR
jgi:pyruvate,water dikinase